MARRHAAILAEVPGHRYNVRANAATVIQKLTDAWYEVISPWAVRHCFISTEGSVPTWILQWVEEIFSSWGGQLPPRPIQGPEGKVGLAIGAIVRSSPAFRLTPRNDGETKKRYKVRQVGEFRRWLEFAVQPPPKSPSPKKEKQGNYETVHHELLVLKICGVRRKDIFARYKRRG